ncbi:hypothetical protein KBZ18_04995 [Synechococcus sp. Cruz-9H2]|nr:MULTISPECIES: hypothetical protein [unclassified Synechococcus]MCP9818846.1 hypothetical protein [Synechococcus sp. Cruz-9H2]MCP9843349.1 hypothetical protein [Synechococcus sp. Edmonson 11F2]MCP9855268.1 hypothetical protein [Synechococcus sp. Cruz-9C9]MCP9862759.1 hypothetical protein [Synechococcus sp. Cruz-7E5]MCP9869756.1 hypothetical protein [Synechococcus sp. Cruz-7B9]
MTRRAQWAKHPSQVMVGITTEQDSGLLNGSVSGGYGLVARAGACPWRR